jgi:hypothetical protein
LAKQFDLKRINNNNNNKSVKWSGQYSVCGATRYSPTLAIWHEQHERKKKRIFKKEKLMPATQSGHLGIKKT